MIIESAQNETFKRLMSLTSSKGLKAEGLFMLSGEKLIREFLKKPTLDVAYEVLAPSQKSLMGNDTPILHLSGPLFQQLDVLGTHFNILVLTQPTVPLLTAQDLTTYQPQGIELVLPLGDPGNLGALLRSCEAFGISRAILSREAAHPFLPKAVKASAGSVIRLPLARGPALTEFPQESIALDMTGTAIDSFTWPANGLLLVGEEGPGFGKGLFPNRVRIPTSGVESLNVVVAASIALSRIPHKF